MMQSKHFTFQHNDCYYTGRKQCILCFTVGFRHGDQLPFLPVDGSHEFAFVNYYSEQSFFKFAS